jgi:hypothetical protein
MRRAVGVAQVAWVLYHHWPMITLRRWAATEATLRALVGYKCPFARTIGHEANPLQVIPVIKSPDSDLPIADPKHNRKVRISRSWETCLIDSPPLDRLWGLSLFPGERRRPESGQYTSAGNSHIHHSL